MSTTSPTPMLAASCCSSSLQFARAVTSWRTTTPDLAGIQSDAGRRCAVSVTPLRPPPPRLPPTNVEAEQALLGAILVNNRAYGAVAGFLRPEHFSNAVHCRIF